MRESAILKASIKVTSVK